jgi:two-component system, sensor histidine kinase and response regulator
MAEKILLVDDIHENLQVLFQILNRQGFEVLIAEDGQTGLEIANDEIPDLVLLDIMMPNMNGFEVCTQLKASEKTRDIPIIFMTALNDINNKITGFNLGAVDYITKPIQHEEALARIRTHLTMQKLKKALQESNKNLLERHQELATKNEELKIKNDQLDAFSYMVAHDLKNPLNLILGMTDIVLKRHPELDYESTDQLQSVIRAGHQMFEIIESLLLLARIGQQKVESTPIEMGEIIQQVEYRLSHLFKQYNGTLEKTEDFPLALGYAPWVTEIWANYLSNALKYGGRPPKIVIGANVQTDKKIRFWVRDNGKGLSEEAKAKLFNPFTRLSDTMDAEGHGLGLAIVKRIVKKLGGEIGVESCIGEGSLFYFTLPSPENQLNQQDIKKNLERFQTESSIIVDLSLKQNSEHNQGWKNYKSFFKPTLATTFHEMAILGDIEGILAFSENLKECAPELREVTDHIKTLANNMQIRQLRQIAEYYLAGTT